MANEKMSDTWFFDRVSLIFCPCVEAIDLFTLFCYNHIVSILSIPFRGFFKKSQKTFAALEQFELSHAIYSRGAKINDWR
nr:hypothetical protein [uncultured Gemmiger sp.]